MLKSPLSWSSQGGFRAVEPRCAGGHQGDQPGQQGLRVSGKWNSPDGMHALIYEESCRASFVSARGAHGAAVVIASHSSRTFRLKDRTVAKERQANSKCFGRAWFCSAAVLLVSGGDLGWEGHAVSSLQGFSRSV